MSMVFQCRIGHFNPRAHEGHDISANFSVGVQIISIHVPTRGTTEFSHEMSNQQQFQSTCPRGARLTYHSQHTNYSIFQSTCPRGARPASKQIAYLPFSISIHVPTRGTTVPPNKKDLCLENFNPRAHEGHDSKEYIRLILVYISTAQFRTSWANNNSVYLHKSLFISFKIRIKLF